MAGRGHRRTLSTEGSALSVPPEARVFSSRMQALDRQAAIHRRLDGSDDPVSRRRQRRKGRCPHGLADKLMTAAHAPCLTQ